MELFYSKTPKDGKTTDPDEAKRKGRDFVDNYLNTFSGVRDWIKSTQAFCHKYGYVKTMFGRRRRTPDIFSSNKTLVRRVERQCINAPVQGTGADFTMLSVIMLNRELKERGYKSLIVATVHDSIVLDVFIPEIPEVLPLAQRCMETSWNDYIPTDIPVGADGELGVSYGSMFGVESDEIAKITDRAKFEDWYVKKVANRAIKSEAPALKKAGFTLAETMMWMRDNDRPVGLVEDAIKELYSA